MPTPIVAGNWKMNTTLPEAVRLASQVSAALGSLRQVEVVLCPPFVSLAAVGQMLGNTAIKLGAQNMHHQEKGAFTGEVSVSMLTNLCQYVILGHSERRLHFGESDEMINRKVQAAFNTGLRPILCVGETLQQREEGAAAEVVTNQVRGALKDLHNIQNLAVAYEPVWAIGTGMAATPETAVEMMGGVILRVLGELYGEEMAEGVPLLYGGSVTPQNVEGFVSQECVHGALVGGASLDAGQFTAIVESTLRAKGYGR